MKKCKFCMTEIDIKAKICPNCKKDLRDFSSRHPIITIILFLFITGTIISGMTESRYSGELEKTNTNSFDPTSPYTDGTCSTNEKNTVIKYFGIIDGEVTDCISSSNSIIGTIIGHNSFNAKIAKNFICDKDKCIYKE